MSTPLVLGCFWVLLATVTALLPMRRQFIPGSVLLLSAPVLLVWIGIAHGWVWVVVGLLAFGSMMRNPLRYLVAKARGQEPELPEELRS
ncbi:DUF2484 family protein [Flavimaricola marinus]|uniref:UDP-N-acetylmuramate--alanine ligase n=1 Tax=Flavimaricola marinus TaxID=1819565 RepID=A0A238LDC4_9RHOB|nr:DUF2484 family protein [Flavimaricola marinus]SMY07717.1 hypothetical protein LOM8899_01857 [Flavimaricola marinus]